MVYERDICENGPLLAGLVAYSAIARVRIPPKLFNLASRLQRKPGTCADAAHSHPTWDDKAQTEFPDRSQNLAIEPRCVILHPL